MVTSVKIRVTGSIEPCKKCNRTNHITSECRVGTTKCMWCGSTSHLIVACPTRVKVVETRVVKTLAPPRQAPSPLKPAVAGRVYVMNKKEALNFSTVITETLF